MARRCPGEILTQRSHTEAKALRRHVIAWLVLCLALAVHVADEALTDFLSFYNPSVDAIRRRLPLLPLPTFSFKSWLASLIFATIALLLLSHFVSRGLRWTIPASYAFGVFMLVNGILHIAWSLNVGRLMPGTYSAPLLIGASIYLLICTNSRRHSQS